MSTKTKNTKLVKTKSVAVPKRNRRYKRRVQPVDKNKDLKARYDSKGTDPRIGKSLPLARNISPSASVDVLRYIALPQPISVLGASIGWVSLLCERGFMVSDNPSAPYHLTRFIYELMIAAMQNSVLVVTDLPYSLACLLASLRPKQLRFKTGAVSLSWNPELLPWNFDYLVSGQAPPMHLGVISDSATVLGYNVLVPPSPYTPELGLDAWSSMLAFVASIKSVPGLRLVKSTDRTMCDMDGSAFAMCYPEIGIASGLGGTTVSLSGPVVIKSPILSVFRDYAGGGSLVVESTIFANSPRFLGQRLLTFADDRNLRSKFKPLFRLIDFNDLFDSLSYQVGRAVELATSSNVSTIVTPTCPLTGQQVALILRSALTALSHHAMASDMCADGFQPLQYPYAVATASTTTRNMIMPKWFVENFKAFQLVAKPLTSDSETNQVMLFIPVFGVFGDDIRSYEVTYGDGSHTLYTPAGENEVQFHMCTLGTVETVQQFIAPIGNNLGDAIVIWNQWISQFSAVMPLDSFSTSNTNPALYALLYTRYVTDLPVQRPMPELLTKTDPKRKSKEVPRPFAYSQLIKKVKTVRPVNTPIHSEVAIGSNQPIVSDVLEIMTNWVLPKNYIGWANDLYDGLNQYAGANYEPHLFRAVPNKMGDTDVYPSLEAKFIAGGDIATHSPTGEPHTLLKQLMTADIKGEGGFLGQMLGDFAASMFGIPMLSQLGSLIPF